MNRRQWKKHRKVKQAIYDSVELSKTLAFKLDELSEAMKGFGVSMDEAIKNIINKVKVKK